MAKLLVNPASAEIQWSDQNHYLFLNPKWPNDDFQILQQACEEFLLSELKKSSNLDQRLDHDTNEGFFILASSGTTRSDAHPALKLKLISKKSFLKAADAFNCFFSIDRNDIFFRALPLFHVGGLALHARAFLSGATVVEAKYSNKWDAGLFIEELLDNSVTRLSLVPTQVFDLVQKSIRAPSILKTVFVGGAQLSVSLRDAAIDLGWPLLASYGMTETSSMAASQRFEDCRKKNLKNEFFPLPGIKFRTNQENQILIRSPGLLSYELEISLKTTKALFKVLSFKSQEEFLTQDFGHWNGECLEILGRQQDLIKISGELVSMTRLRSLWEESAQLEVGGFFEQTCLLTLPDERREHEVIVVIAKSQGQLNKASLEKIDRAVADFNQRVLPFERIRRIVEHDEIPRTELGKIKIEVLKEQIQNLELGKPQQRRLEK